MINLYFHYNKARHQVWNCGVQLERYSPKNCSREFFILGDNLIKIDTYPQSDNQSYLEAMKWDKIEEIDRKYFAPRLAHGETNAGDTCDLFYGYWIMVPFYRTGLVSPYRFSAQKQTEFNKKIHRLAKKYRLSDVIASGGYNWAVLNGHPIILDYGY